MFTGFDVQHWMNSNWSDLNDSHWYINETWENDSSTTVQPDAGVSPPPDLIFRILATFLEYRISQYVGTYGYPILIVIGTIGNAFTLLVMTRKSMISVTTCFYMAVLAVADTFVLYFSCLRRWISYFQNYETSNVSPAGCKVLTFITYWTFQYASWVLVVMTIDRFLAIHFPLKVLSFRLLRKPKWITAIVALVCAAFDVQYFFIVDINDEGNCQPLPEFTQFHAKVWPWLDATIYSFLPFVLLLLFNIIIIWDNKRAQKRQNVLHAALDCGPSTVQMRQDINNKITVMLLTVSFSFLIMSAPKVILLIIRDNAFDFYGDNGSINWLNLARYRLVAAIVNLFMYMNHSINFFLYCISGQKFRQELRNIFSRKTTFDLRMKRQSVMSTCTSLSELNVQSSSNRPSSSDASINSEVSDRVEPQIL